MEKKEFWKKSKYVILTSFVVLVLTFSTLSLAGTASVRSVSVEHLEEETVKDEGGSVGSTDAWTHTSVADFQTCDRQDVIITGSGTAGSVEIGKRDINNIGNLDTPSSTDPWPGGKTIKSDDEAFQMDRGGTVRQISIQLDHYTGPFKIKVLRNYKPNDPNWNDYYWCVHTTTGLDPNTGGITHFNASEDDFNPFEVEAGDWIGIYTYGGDLYANASWSSETPGWHIYNGEITDGQGNHEQMNYHNNGIAYIPLEVDIKTYKTQGNITKSPTYDTGQYMYEWGGISWSSDVPTDTSLTVETRTSDDQATWSDWQQVSNGDTIPNPAHRYVEYRVFFTTSRGDDTPILHDITLTWHEDDTPPTIESSPLGWQQDGPYLINASIYDDPLESGVDETTPYIRYSTDGGNTWTNSDMQPTGSGYYEGTIPNQDGGTEVLYEIHAVDIAGNAETFPDDHFSFSVDKTAPATSFNPEGDEGEAGWYKSNVDITLSAPDSSQADGSAGRYNITYRVDGGQWQEYTDEFTVSGDGRHNVSYYATDNVGNVETVQKQTIKIDTNIPETDYQINGESGRGEWYRSEVDVVLTGHDTEPGVETSGVLRTRYQIDEGTWKEYTESFTISDDGEHTITYQSTDNAGNSEELREKSIDIDTTVPSLTASLDGKMGANDKWYTGPVDVNLTSSDATSGVLRTRYQVDGEPWKMGESFQITEEGVHTVNYSCTDNAGLQVTKNMTVSLDLSGPSVSMVTASETSWRQDMTITARINDPNSDVKDVYIQYNTGDGFKKETMKGGGGTYTATIPGSEVGFNGEVEYQVYAEDFAGNQQSTRQQKAEVGINWLFIIPIPIIIGVLLFIFYAKKRREKEKEILPVKESKIDRISSRRDDKLDQLDQTRQQRKASGQEGKMALTDRLKQTISGGAVGGENSCDICGSTMNPDAAVQCPCGNIYHDDCLREEGNCTNCERDYAEISETYSPPEARQEPREERSYDSQPPSSMTGGGTGRPPEEEGTQPTDQQPSEEQQQQQPPQPPQPQGPQQPPSGESQESQPPQGGASAPAPEDQSREKERERVMESLREPVSKTVKEQEAQEASTASSTPPPSQGEEIFDEEISDEDLDKDIERMLETEEEDEEGIVYECPNCGESVSSDAKECPNCGAIFKE